LRVVRATFCGVRGSTPAPGAEFVRTGGHTSCVAISPSADTTGAADPAGGDPGDRPPTLLLDAGTGIRRVPALLGDRPFRGSILLTHLHWDHVQGIPFFPAGDRDDARVRLVMPAQGDPVAVLSGAMSPPHFPIGPDGLRGAWEFRGLEPGCHQVEGFDVLAAELPHKGGRTYGYRVTDPAGRSLAYMPDHGPLGQGPGPDGLGARHAAARALAEGVDVLVHGGQFTAAEAPMAEAFGHATVDYAVALATEAGVGRLVLFHHSPARTDDQVDAIAAALGGAPVPVTVAREALALDV
jgi:phosphoribosyl 1,2-cyclic phosphodiesterase